MSHCISSDRSDIRVLQQEFLSNERFFKAHYLILSSPDKFRTVFKKFVKDLVDKDLKLLGNGVIIYESFYFKNIHGRCQMDENNILFSISFYPYWDADKVVPGAEIQHFIFHMDQEGVIKNRFFVQVDVLNSSSALIYQVKQTGLSEYCGKLEDSDIETVYEYLQENSITLLNISSLL